MWKYHSAVESVLCLISVSSDLDRNRKDASTASPLQATTCLEMLQIVASNIFAQFHVNCRVICVLRSIYIIREIRIVRLVCPVLLPLSEGVAAVVAHPTARGVRLINAGKREPMDSAMRRSAEGVSQRMPHSVCLYTSRRLSVCLSACSRPTCNCWSRVDCLARLSSDGYPIPHQTPNTCEAPYRNDWPWWSPQQQHQQWQQ